MMNLSCFKRWGLVLTIMAIISFPLNGFASDHPCEDIQNISAPCHQESGDVKTASTAADHYCLCCLAPAVFIEEQITVLANIAVMESRIENLTFYLLVYPAYKPPKTA